MRPIRVAGSAKRLILTQAVQKALEFARKDGNTPLVIVTADHAHASQIIPADSKAPEGLTQF